MSRRVRLALLAAGALSAPTASAQAALHAVVEDARAAWLRHDARSLFSTSDTVRLRLPQLPAAQGLQPAQAMLLMARMWAGSSEIEFEIREVRQVAEGHAFAELVRVFGMRGTEDQQTQTVYFGLRYLGQGWRLREVRITP